MSKTWQKESKEEKDKKVKQETNEKELKIWVKNTQNIQIFFTQVDVRSRDLWEYRNKNLTRFQKLSSLQKNNLDVRQFVGWSMNAEKLVFVNTAKNKSCTVPMVFYRKKSHHQRVKICEKSSVLKLEKDFESNNHFEQKIRMIGLWVDFQIAGM